MTIKITFDISDRFATILERFMATFADFNAKLDKIEADIAAHDANDAAVVNDLNQQIAALQAQVDAKQGDMTADEEQKVMDRLDAVDAKLNPTTP